MSSSSSSSGCFHVYNTPGTYEWTCPEGVFAVDVVCVGGGSSGYFGDDSGPQLGRGGGGGGKVNAKISVTPGLSYTLVIGAGGAAVTSPGCNNGTDSSFTGDGGATAIGRGGNQHNGGGVVAPANVGDHIINGDNGSVSIFGLGGRGGDSARGSGGAGATFSSVAVFGGSAGGGGGGGATTSGGNTPTVTQRYGATGGPGMVSISCSV